ncbi:MAG: hypothetical protein DRJ38_09805 [Thermoprotei archaeon]|nr:MAG: hypothetical protein DRJ38_09805 [Thermoprotei archaeon]
MISKQAIKQRLSDFIVILRGNAGIIMLTWFIFSLGSALSQPFFSLYVKELGGTDVEIGVIRSAGAMAGLALILPGGYITDRYGRRKIIIVMTWAIAVIFLFYAFVQDWRQLLILVAMDEALHFYQPALIAIMTDSMPPGYRGRGWALSNIVSNLPWLFMPIFGGYLIDIFGIVGFRIGFLIQALMSFIAAGIRTVFLKETIKVESKQEFSLSEMLKSYAETIGKLSHSVKVIIVERAVLGTIGTTAMNLYAVVYATEMLGISKVDWGLASSLGTLTSLLTTIISLEFIDRIKNRNKVISAALLLNALGIISLISLKGTIAAVAFFILTSITSSFVWPSINALLGDLTPRELRGKRVAVGNLLNRISITILAPIIGFFYMVSPNLAFIIAILFTLIRATIYLLFVHEPKKREM